MICGNSGCQAVSPAKIHRAAARLQHPAAPQRAIAAPGRATAEVLRRGARDGQTKVVCRLAIPPAVLADRRRAEPPQLAAHTDRRHPPGFRVAPNDASQRAAIEVVVVIVGEDDEVQRRQVVERDTRADPAPRSRETERRGALAPHRIGQHVERSQLQQRAGVSDPRHRQGAVAGARGVKRRRRDREARGRRVGRPPRPRALAHPFEHRAETGHGAAGPGVRVSTCHQTQHIRAFRADPDAGTDSRDGRRRTPSRTPNGSLTPPLRRRAYGGAMEIRQHTLAETDCCGDLFEIWTDAGRLSCPCPAHAPASGPACPACDASPVSVCLAARPPRVAPALQFSTCPSSVGSALRAAIAIAAIGGITAVYMRLPLNPTTVALTYVVAILTIATTWGILESTIASIVAMLCLNFFFLPPVGTLTISDPAELGGARRLHGDGHRDEPAVGPRAAPDAGHGWRASAISSACTRSAARCCSGAAATAPGTAIATDIATIFGLIGSRALRSAHRHRRRGPAQTICRTSRGRCATSRARAPCCSTPPAPSSRRSGWAARQSAAWRCRASR